MSDDTVRCSRHGFEGCECEKTAAPANPSDSLVMDEVKVKEILGGDGDNIFTDKGGLHSLGWCLDWGIHDDTATLDGEFSADELEAIAWWMRRNFTA